MNYPQRCRFWIGPRLKSDGDVRVTVAVPSAKESEQIFGFPLSFSQELYHLRMHIDMLRSKLKQMIKNGP